MKNGMSVRRFLLQNPNATTKAVVAATGAMTKSVSTMRSVLRKEGIECSPPKTRRARRLRKFIDLSAAGSPITDKTEFIMPDPVNHPAHYTTGGIETIDFIEAKNLNYNLGNAVKYITRAGLKGNRLQDLQKAKWYLEREILSSHI